MNDQVHGFSLLGGVQLGKITSFSEDGIPQVDVAGTTHSARALLQLDEEHLGSEVAVVALAGAENQLLILGLIDPPVRKRTVIDANNEIVLLCGKSSIMLEADGSITIKGKQLLSRAEGQNRVQGANVSLN
ncbi:MAG: DUF6484 domain-containing protein [Rhodobacterales bacterium]|nr:DUF6484 domain-containing protein [Rhodobacterales bacterium]